MNKKGDIAITLLVIMTIVTAVAASMVLISGTNKIEGNIYQTSNLEGVYSESDKLDFYIGEIMGVSVKRTLGEMEKESGQTITETESETFRNSFTEKFVPIFMDELGKYKDENSKFVYLELEQVGGQMNSNNIRITNNKVSCTFNLAIRNEVGKISVYTYTKTFEKEIMQENI